MLWCAVKPIANHNGKSVRFELIKGSKGEGSTIKNSEEDFDPSEYNTICRGVGKCINCGNIIANEHICSPGKPSKLGHQVYAVAYRDGLGKLEFSVPRDIDLLGIQKAEKALIDLMPSWEEKGLVSHESTPFNPQYSMIRNYGIIEWSQCFNPRQLLTLITYERIIDDAKQQIKNQNDPCRSNAIITYLAFILDRCIDYNSRLSGWHSGHPSADRASKTHALNLNWNYPEINGSGQLWYWCADAFVSDGSPGFMVIRLAYWNWRS